MKPIASLSLDLDNQWSYMKTHGDLGWENYPSYFHIVVPRILDLLENCGLTISFFIVGRDATMQEHHGAVRAITEAGHEIGNHSFNHDPWLHLYSENELDEELARAEQAIEQATGCRPVGFRGPGYSLSAAVIHVLSRRGYLYDATVFPNVLNPLARAYFFAKSKLTPEEKKQRECLFGSFRDGLGPIKPYLWAVDSRTMVEVPVTTMPIFRIPIHMSYVLYLSTFSERLARNYFRVALEMCRLRGVEPSILLHPLDFLSEDDVSELSFFPGMSMCSKIKLERLEQYLRDFTGRFAVGPIGPYVETVRGRGGLKTRHPVFPQTAWVQA